MDADSRSPRELALELARRAARRGCASARRPRRPRARRRGRGRRLTFAIDEQAEAFLERFLAERAPDVAFYSEDRGLVAPRAGAGWVLVVDPIDGTRPAMAGLEAACVSVAAARLEPDGETRRWATSRSGCVVEIKSGRGFVAERGGGPRAGAVAVGERGPLAACSGPTAFAAGPVRAIAEVLGELIDASSVGGGTFDLGSATFDMTRIVTGQLDAYVEPGPRIVADVPGMREEFERVGGRRGAQQLALRPGRGGADPRGGRAVVTDAYGEPLADRPLLGSGAEFQLSCVAAANRELHDGDPPRARPRHRAARPHHVA